MTPSKTKNWYVGDVWVMTWKPTDPITGVPVKPTIGAAEVIKPDGMTAVVAVTEPEPNVFRGRVVLTAAGEWDSELVTTGEYQGVKPGRIRVLPKRTGG